MKVAIIPARIGSKRIPKKNIKNFCGKPIIFWAIKAIKKNYRMISISSYESYKENKDF